MQIVLCASLAQHCLLEAMSPDERHDPLEASLLDASHDHVPIQACNLMTGVNNIWASCTKTQDW